MINKTVVERYLRTNGVSPSAPDDEIKSILFSAKWHQTDVETALMVLRENASTHEEHIDSLHKVFHSDDRLEPETISALLGIDVELTPDTVTSVQTGMDFKAILAVFVVAVLITFGLATFVLWHMKMGPFYVL